MFRAAKPDVDRGNRFGTVQFVERVVGRRDDGCPPPFVMQRDGQVMDDVCNAADLATRKCAILCGRKYNVSGTDGNLPIA